MPCLDRQQPELRYAPEVLETVTTIKINLSIDRIRFEPQELQYKASRVQLEEAMAGMCTSLSRMGLGRGIAGLKLYKAPMKAITPFSLSCRFSALLMMIREFWRCVVIVVEVQSGQATKRFPVAMLHVTEIM
jgi:hypothetical protein